MSALRTDFDVRTVHLLKNVSARLKAECARRRQARGGACYISELVNEYCDALVPQLDGESPVIPIKKVKAKARTSARWKQPA